MKRLLPLFVFLSFTLAGIAQTVPQGINYQAVARDNNGEVLPNQSIGLRISVISDAPLNGPDYVETHTLTTNNVGLFGTVIGTGTPVQGNFQDIDWSTTTKYIQVEVDPQGGTNYNDLGTTQLLSVPFAMVADTTLSASGDDWGGQVAVTGPALSGEGTQANPLDLASQAATQGQVLKWNGSAWVPGNDDIDIGGQTLQVSARLSGNGSMGSPLDIAGQGAGVGQVLKWNGTSWAPGADASASYTGVGAVAINNNQISLNLGTGLAENGGNLEVVPFGGDLSGNPAGATVTGLQNRSLSNAAPNNGDVLTWDGSAWAPQTPGGGTQSPWTESGQDVYRLNGNVGIGTSTPFGALQVNIPGSTADPHLSLFQPNAADFAVLSFDNQGTNNYWAIAGRPSQGADSRLNFFSSDFGGFDVMSLNSAGQVGMGTTNPYSATLLDVFSGARHAGYFESDSVAGQTSSLVGIYRAGGNVNAIGVYGESFANDGWGLGGEFQGGSIGVSGYGDGANYNGGYSIIGVYGEATAANNINGTTAIGVYGVGDGNTEFNYSVYGFQPNNLANFDYAGFFEGDVHVNGFLSKSGGTFRIDHPQDPANKYLVHSFVESPEMMNVYNGNVTTDANGVAVVELPDYFQALNRDFRYQLTTIGSFADAMVKEEIEGNRFVIQTEEPNVKVSWQVTGVRQDPWAEEHPIVVEQEKTGTARGRYLNPELYGQPAERGIHYNARPAGTAEGRRIGGQADLRRKAAERYATPAIPRETQPERIAD